jgi:hypothetical protein
MWYPRPDECAFPALVTVLSYASLMCFLRLMHVLDLGLINLLICCLTDDACADPNPDECVVLVIIIVLPYA